MKRVIGFCYEHGSRLAVPRTLPTMGSFFSRHKPAADISFLELGQHIVTIDAYDESQRTAALAIATRSFAGTAKTDPEGTIDWFLGPKLQGQWQDPRRHLMVAWLMKYMLEDVKRGGGFVLGGQKEDGELGAVIFAIPEMHGHTKESVLQIMARVPFTIGLPPFGKMGDAQSGIEKRIDAADVLQDMHAKFNKPHVYVKMMAVDPDGQGQGFCGKLMRKVNDYADHLNLPCWLETNGERNVAIYKRFGYQIEDDFFDMPCVDDPDKFGACPKAVTMSRPAQGK